jgi:hypothetical protein
MIEYLPIGTKVMYDPEKLDVWNLLDMDIKLSDMRHIKNNYNTVYEIIGILSYGIEAGFPYELNDETEILFSREELFVVE